MKLIMTPHFSCASNDLRLSRLPTSPIISPARGSRISTNSVSCQLMKIIVDRQTMIMTGFLNSMSRLAITLASISATSPLIRAMTSPLRSPVKKPIGRRRIFSYIELRMSRTIPLRSGTIKYELRYVVPVFSAVIATRTAARSASVFEGPNDAIPS